MEKPISKSTVFITGAARFHDLIYLIGRDKNLDVQHVEHSRLIGFDGGKFGHMGDRNWNAHAIAIVKQPTACLVIMGESGEVFTYAAGKSTSGQISPEPSAIRSAGVINGYVYACGMKHEVYRRNGDDSWIMIPNPVEQMLADLEAIGGFGESEVYAAGWSGEVWLWDGTSWSVVSALTNRILTSMCITDRGEVVICGQGGVMICKEKNYGTELHASTPHCRRGLAADAGYLPLGQHDRGGDEVLPDEYCASYGRDVS